MVKLTFFFLHHGINEITFESDKRKERHPLFLSRWKQFSLSFFLLQVLSTHARRMTKGEHKEGEMVEWHLQP